MKVNFLILISLAATSLLMSDTDAKALYDKKCASCHGVNAEKKALGTSKVLNTLDKQEIVNALVGYKDGTYSGKYKSLKRGIAKKLSEEDINTVAAYAQTLRPQP